jgi:lipopolysaccharide heptosyltransferase III
VVRERGNPLLRVADRYAGVPLVAAAGALKRRRPLPAEIRRIGILNATAIGDTVLLSAVARDLAAAFPDAETILFSSRANLPFLGTIDGLMVRPIRISSPREAVRALRAARLDVVLDFDSWPRIEPVYCLLSGASFTAGFRTAGQHRHYAFDAWVEHSRDVHTIENFRRLASVLGVESTSLPSLRPPGRTELPPSPYVVLHLWPTGVSSGLKEWPEERWRELARQLVAAGNTIVLTGAPGDADRTGAFVEAAPDLREHLVDGAGRWDLGELLDVLAGSRCVVSVNTGVMHMAAAADVPTVALNGPTSELRWGPLGSRAVSVSSELPGCGYLYLGWEYDGERSDCMEGISVERVLEAVEQLTREPLPA